MESILSSIGGLLNSLGSLIVLPIVIAILGLILGMKLTHAIRSGLTLAIAFIGIGLTVGLLGEKMSTIGTAFAEKTGTGLDVIDIGWPAASALAFNTPVGNAIIPIGIVLNIILILLGLTQTLDVDIWNFWHQAFIGAIVTFITGSFALGLLAAAINVVMALFLADWSAPLIQRYFKLPGISFPHLQSAGYMMLAVPFAWLLNKVPFPAQYENWIRIPCANASVFWANPSSWACLFGIALSGMAGESVADVILTGINVGAVMLLIPRMVAILMEGLTPVAEAARKFMTKHTKDAVSHRFGLGCLDRQSRCNCVGLLMVPVEIGMALLLAPLGNRTLPFIDLADGVFVTAMLGPLVAGDVLLTVILGAIVMGIGMIFTTCWLRPSRIWLCPPVL